MSDLKTLFDSPVCPVPDPSGVFSGTSGGFSLPDAPQATPTAEIGPQLDTVNVKDAPGAGAIIQDVIDRSPKSIG